MWKLPVRTLETLFAAGRRCLPVVAALTLVFASALISLEATPSAATSGSTFNGTTKAAWPTDQSATLSSVTQLTSFGGLRSPVLRFTTYNGDVYPETPTVNPRSQLVGPTTILQGDVLWESWEMFIPNSFPDVPDLAWVVLVTPAYGPPFAGFPPLVLDVRGDNLRLDADAYAPVPYEPVWSTPLPRGRWVRYTIHFDFASNGWIEFWVNDKLQWLQEDPGPRVHVLPYHLVDATNDGGPNSARLSVYYLAGAFPMLTAYFADFRVGLTRAQVEPQTSARP